VVQVGSAGAAVVVMLPTNSVCDQRQRHESAVVYIETDSIDIGAEVCTASNHHT